VFIYVGKTFTATATGSAIRDVRCERCRCEYHYELARTGVGRASAPYYLGQRSAAARAERGAANDLRKKLGRDHELVPCPGCGWVDSEAIRHVRRRSHRWAYTLMIVPGVALAGSAIIALGVYLDRYAKPGDYNEPVEWGLVAVAACAALAAMRWFLASRIDPNAGYPRYPEPLPGTPPALYAVAAPDGSTRYELARPDDAPAPPGEWVQVQLMRCALPDACVRCLAEPERTFHTPLDSPSNLEAPLCRACDRSIRRRWWGWTAVTILVVPALCLPLLWVPGADETGRWILWGIVALFATVFAVAGIPRWRVMPYRMRWVDRERGVVRLWFENPAYTRRLAQIYAAMEASIAVAPVPAVSPPPTARSTA
jgi:hypothetical protein